MNSYTINGNIVSNVGGNNNLTIITGDFDDGEVITVKHQDQTGTYNITAKCITNIDGNNNVSIISHRRR